MQYPSGLGYVPNFFGGGKSGFQDGDPTTGVQGTELQAAVFNDILGNLMKVLDTAGVAPTPNRYDDLLDAIRSVAVLFHGQCQLRFASTVAISLAPYGGRYLRINGKTYALAAGGLPIANTNVMVSGVAAQNLAASTVYLLFVKDNGAGVVIPDFWPVATGHVADTTAGNVGVEVRDAGAGVPDPTRTLIGMVATDGASHFVDFLTLSWFNRRDRVQRTNFSSNPTTSSNGVLVEPSSSIRNSFIVWAGEGVAYAFAGSATLSVGNDVAVSAVGFDGTTPEREGSIFEGFTGDTTGNAAFTGFKSGLSEGLHYATMLGMFGIAGGGGAGTATWQGGTSPAPANPPSVLQIKVRG